MLLLPGRRRARGRAPHHRRVPRRVHRDRGTDAGELASRQALTDRITSKASTAARRRRRTPPARATPPPARATPRPRRVGRAPPRLPSWVHRVCPAQRRPPQARLRAPHPLLPLRPPPRRHPPRQPLPRRPLPPLPLPNRPLPPRLLPLAYRSSLALRAPATTRAHRR